MDSLPESSLKSRYGIEKLNDHNYQNWSFQCRMLLQERKVWKLVTGEFTSPEAELEQRNLTDAARRKIQKELDE